jgi:hypothetical protein
MYRSAPARCFAKRCVGQLRREFVRRQIAEPRMRAHRVEVLPPALDNHLRFGTRAEPFEAEALIAEFAVEAFRDAILPRLARFDQCSADALRDDPGQQRSRYELRTIVAAQEARRTALADQARQHIDDAWRANASSRAFSASSCRRRRTSFASKLPNRLRQL